MATNVDGWKTSRLFGGLQPVVTLLALVAYGVAVAAIDWNAEDFSATHVLPLLVLPLAAFAVGNWWTLTLPLLPVVGAWWLVQRECEPGLYSFCGLATAFALLIGLFIGMPLVALGIWVRRYVDGRR